MSTQKEPVALRDGATPAPLRRGRGLRLSTETTRQELQKSPVVAHRKASPVQLEPAATMDTAQTLAEPAVTTDTAQAEASDQPAVREQAAPVEPASAPEDSAIPSDPQEPARRKRELRLRKDLLKACKRIAREQNRKLGQVIETALEEYIQRYGAQE